MTLQKCPGCGKETFIPPNSTVVKSWCTCGYGSRLIEFSEPRYIKQLQARIAELEAENARITDAYKLLIDKLNEEDEINISP